MEDGDNKVIIALEDEIDGAQGKALDRARSEGILGT